MNPPSFWRRLALVPCCIAFAVALFAIAPLVVFTMPIALIRWLVNGRDSFDLAFWPFSWPTEALGRFFDRYDGYDS